MENTTDEYLKNIEIHKITLKIKNNLIKLKDNLFIENEKKSKLINYFNNILNNIKNYSIDELNNLNIKISKEFF